MTQFVKKCPECGSINLFINKEKGEIICKDCGLVIEDKMIDFTQEWREFGDSGEDYEKFRRTGAPMTYTQYDQGLGTEVGRKADLYAMGDKDRSKFFRLRKWQYRISTAIERNLKLALTELKRVGSYLKLPKSVEEEAARIYTLAVQRGLVRGRSMESVVAGALTKEESIIALEEIKVSTGNKIKPTAFVKLKIRNESKNGSGEGVGPVDAVCNAIRSVVGPSISLKEYNLKAITGGTDALAEVAIKVEDDRGNIFKAEAVDEDVIMASTKAFMQGINKALNFKKATIKATEGAI